MVTIGFSIITVVRRRLASILLCVLLAQLERHNMKVSAVLYDIQTESAVVCGD